MSTSPSDNIAGDPRDSVGPGGYKKGAQPDYSATGKVIESESGKDLGGNTFAKSGPLYTLGLARKAVAAREAQKAVDTYEEAFARMLKTWCLASGLYPVGSELETDVPISLKAQIQEADFFARMPMLVVEYTRARALAAASVGKPELWEQVLMLAQEGRMAFELAETLATHKLNGGK